MSSQKFCRKKITLSANNAINLSKISYKLINLQKLS